MTTTLPIVRQTPAGDRLVSTARIPGYGYRSDRYEVLVFDRRPEDGGRPAWDLGGVYSTVEEALADHEALVAALGGAQ